MLFGFQRALPFADFLIHAVLFDGRLTIYRFLFDCQGKSFKFHNFFLVSTLSLTTIYKILLGTGNADVKKKRKIVHLPFLLSEFRKIA